MSQAGPSSQLHRLRVGALLGVVATALLELGAVLWGCARPSLKTLRPSQLRAAVAPLVKSGDLVTASPAGLELPLLAGAGEAISREATVLVDPSRFARAVELSWGGASQPSLKGWSRGTESRVGAVRLRVLTNPSPLPVRYDLVAKTAPSDAQVSHGPAGSAGLPCNHLNAAEVDLPPGLPLAWTPRTRFACGSDPKSFVAPVILEDGRATTRRCLWTFPTTNAVRVTWQRVAGGTKLRAGFAVPAAPTGSPLAKVSFKANGAVVVERQVGPSSTFDSVDVPVPMLSAGGEITLEVEQLSEHLAPVCVEASVR